MTRVIEAEVAVAGGFELGEGPVWDASRGRLVWVDILRGPRLRKCTSSRGIGYPRLLGESPAHTTRLPAQTPRKTHDASIGSPHERRAV